MHVVAMEAGGRWHPDIIKTLKTWAKEAATGWFGEDEPKGIFHRWMVQFSACYAKGLGRMRIESEPLREGTTRWEHTHLTGHTWGREWRLPEQWDDRQEGGVPCVAAWEQDGRMW